MARLCERPGCSEPGAAAYGMVPEDLLFWLEPLDRWIDLQTGVLCRRHADAMVVPRGWFLDDRREPMPRLFRPPSDATSPAPRPRRRRGATNTDAATQQLELGSELPPGVMTVEPGLPVDDTAAARAESDIAAWRPAYDVDDDLGGLLEADSPLLARAFRGTDRPKR